MSEPIGETPDIPRRAYRLVLDLEADDYTELLNALDGIGLQLAMEPRHDGADVTSGGWASGYALEITHNAGTNGDRYRRELTEWADRRRAARRAARNSAAEDSEENR